MISVSAASGRTIAVAIAYAFGSGVVLLGLTLGGRALFDRVRRAGRGPLLQRTLGVIMILTALAIVTNLDVRFDQQVAERIPDVNLTASLEKSHAVESRLHELSGHEAKFKQSVSTPTASHSASQASLLAIAAGLKDVGTAPEFTDTEDWFNTPGNAPLSLASLRGRVVLVDFWTYTCINCIRTLPYLKAWDATYRGQGLTIVGVETPEFSFERDASQRRFRDLPVRDQVPRRPGQRNGHLERLRQRVLAGRLPDRRLRPGSLRDVRRGRLLTRPKPRSARCSPKRGTTSPPAMPVRPM